MYYNIKPGVYIVRGIAKSSIYDCNNDKHYWVDNDIISDFIKLINRRSVDEGTICDALSLELIESTNEVAPQTIIDISELFNFARHIDYAWIELTNQCNLKCSHCYNETDQRDKKQLAYDDFVHIVDELVRYGIKSVQLIGGEPFMIKEDLLYRMLDYASQSFKEFEIFFNGTLCNRAQLERVKNSYPNCSIAMSLHSFIRDEHEKITRIKGSYDKSVATLRNLQDLKMKFRYVGIYVAGLDIGKEMDFGVPYRRDYIRLTGRGNLKHYDRRLLYEKLITLDTFKFNNLRDTLKSTYSEHCFANYIYIGSDLNVYPCVMERRLIHGNLKNRSLSEIIDRSIINFGKEQVEECCECEFRHLCKDCRPDSMGRSIKAKPWYCTYNVKHGVWVDPDEFIDNLLTENQ